MDTIMDHVKNWDSWYVSSLFATVKNHYNMTIFHNNEYTDDDAEKFLSLYQKSEIEQKLESYNSFGLLPATISEFKKLIEDYCLFTRILAIIPYIENCLLCITDTSVYGLIINSSVDVTSCAITIYLTDNRINGYNQPYVYNEKKVYIVNCNSGKDYSLSISTSEKEAQEENNTFYLSAKYNVFYAKFERFINDTIDFEMVYSHDALSYKALDDIENCIFQPELDIVTSCFAYSVFCSRIVNYEITPDQIDQVRLSKYGYVNGDLEVVSFVQYRQGNIDSFKFYKDGALHYLDKNGDWCYSDKTVTIESIDKNISINHKVVIPDNSDILNCLDKSLAIFLNFDLIGYVRKIIYRFKSELLPKFFGIKDDDNIV